MEKLLSITSKFKINQNPVEAIPYGNGHINSTYLVRATKGSEEKKYILQKINHNVFKNVPGLMNNIVAVTEHIAKRMFELGEISEEVLRVIKTRNGESYFFDEKEGCYRLYNYINNSKERVIKLDDGDYYRLYNFIKSGVSIETKATVMQFYACAIGFGQFQKYLDGFDASSLVETIPDFHNTKKRFLNFETAIREDIVGRKAGIAEDIKKYIDREKYCSVVLDELEKGTVPTRVTHNDTKLNNVLINTKTLKPIAVIDLDTVMPGSLLYDFGDSIRSGATTAAEDEIDLSKVHFSLELFEAYTDGFLSQVGARLTPKEEELLAFSAILMTYECGMRFLSDYLAGDTYFRVHRENHNLDRARNQMRLVEDMEEKIDEMKKIVAKYVAKYKK